MYKGVSTRLRDSGAVVEGEVVTVRAAVGGLSRRTIGSHYAVVDAAARWSGGQWVDASGRRAAEYHHDGRGVYRLASRDPSERPEMLDDTAGACPACNGKGSAVAEQERLTGIDRCTVCEGKGG